MTGGSLVDLNYISGDRLVITGESELLGEVYIGGSLSVRGSVVGSGPYMDSSDIRFKTNIIPIQNALEIVNLMKGVNYDFKIDEYQDRNFPKSKQIGWIADEVEQVIPQLVDMDSEGFKSISYAKSTVLLAKLSRK
eukprot:CAMPEP_0119052806 /NCGR_PEP_ID=MMETSP1177-20130426/73978_1 /TAXON_ID=2985 /ORGANISM="Ochromonas sp, Strain CCMP1899" /LENGTH=135 /DNA_ID=CAMNT_0007032489 /DNA_START=693 /DNA_END=1101 /DNA_ORIENTATION=-